jgi:hypothetical protein
LQRASQLAYSTDTDGRRLLTVVVTPNSAAGHAETEQFIRQAQASAGVRSGRHHPAKHDVQVMSRFEIANGVAIDANFRVIFGVYEFAKC